MKFRRNYLTEASILGNKEEDVINVNNTKVRQGLSKKDAKAKAAAWAEGTSQSKKAQKQMAKSLQKDGYYNSEDVVENMLEQGQIEGFRNYKNWSNTFKSALWTSCRQIGTANGQGHDNEVNYFLNYLSVIDSTPLSSYGEDARNALTAIQQFFQKNKISPKRMADLMKQPGCVWITNPNCFKCDNPEYKIKALLSFVINNGEKTYNLRNKEGKLVDVKDLVEHICTLTKSKTIQSQLSVYLNRGPASRGDDDGGEEEEGRGRGRRGEGKKPETDEEKAEALKLARSVAKKFFGEKSNSVNILTKLGIDEKKLILILMTVVTTADSEKTLSNKALKTVDAYIADPSKFPDVK